MKSECPEWAAKIGLEVRRLTEETQCQPQSIESLLRQMDESELAMQRATGGNNQVDLKPANSSG